VERRGDEDKTFTSDDKLDRELFDLLRSMAIDAMQKKNGNACKYATAHKRSVWFGGVVVSGMAQWLGRQSLAGGPSLIYA